MLNKFYVASLLVNGSVHTTGGTPVRFTSNAALKAIAIPFTNVIPKLMAAQEEERAKEQEENIPLIENSNNEEVEVLFLCHS